MRKKILFLFVLMLLLVVSILHAKKEAFKITSIKFEGNNAYTSRTLLKVMVTRPSRFLSPGYYYSELFSKDLDNLALFYHQNGYLQAKIDDYTLDRNEKKKQLSIDIIISEGDPTHIEGVEIFGNTIFPDSTLLQKTNLKKGYLLQQKKVQDATYALLTMYANLGYLDAEVVPTITVNEEHHRALIDFRVSENEQFLIHDIVIKGLEITKKKIVMRELTFKPDEIVDYSKLLASQRSLYLTGLFESVFIRPVSIDSLSSQKDILIEIKEKIPGEFDVGAGYGSLEKVRIFTEVMNNNLWGTAQKVSLNGKLSSINRTIEASYTEPWIFEINLKTDVNLFDSFSEEPGYDVLQEGIKLVVGKSFTEHTDVSLAYRFERVHFSNVEIEEIPDKYNSNLNSLTLSAVQDLRDNIFNTTQGYLLSVDNEIAESYQNSTSLFGKIVIKGKYFWPVTSTTVLAYSIHAGGLTLFGDSQTIPLNERFYAGGPNTLRGFGYRKVGPLDDNGNPLGGRYKIVANMEFRQTIYKFIGAVVFFDFGNVWRYLKDAQRKPLRSCPGIGLRIDTLLGVVRCDYGVNWFPKEGEPSGEFHLSFGQAF